MDKDAPKEKWKIETNDRYQRVIGTLISLASGVLVLPTFFLKVLRIPENESLQKHLTPIAYWGWGLLGCSIFSGVLFYYLSAKWVKNAWGQKTCLPESCIENLLDISFWVQVLLFLAGVALIIWFIVTFNPSNYVVGSEVSPSIGNLQN